MEKYLLTIFTLCTDHFNITEFIQATDHMIIMLCHIKVARVLADIGKKIIETVVFLLEKQPNFFLKLYFKLRIEFKSEY